MFINEYNDIKLRFLTQALDCKISYLISDSGETRTGSVKPWRQDEDPCSGAW